MYEYGEQVFISHRGNDYKKAEELRDFLIKKKLCKYAILFPNESLCYNWEQLLVLEYFELMESIIDYISQSDSFLFIDTPSYKNGYFTQAEILQWRRFKTNPKVYPVSILQNGQFDIDSPISLPPMSREDKKIWAKISVNVNPKMQGKIPVFWSKYARNCFLIGCCNCGEYFLITQKAMKIIIENKLKVECLHCHTASFTLFEDITKKKKFYRYPVILKPNINPPSDLRTLSDSEIIDLLIGDKLPNKINLIQAKDEKLKTDSQKVGKAFGIAGAIIGGILLVSNLFLNESSD